MGRKKHHEEHENHERWLVSYADFITLLFAFFVVITLIGWGALGGFLINGNHSSVTQTTDTGTTQVSRDYKNVLAVR